MNRFTKSVATIFGLSLLLPAAPTNAQIPTGLSVRFTHVFPDGTIDKESSVGITQENVVRVERVNDDQSTTILYCFVGLPPAHGGQVTINTAQGSTFSLTPFLDVTTEDPEACSQTVVIMDLDDETVESSFFLLLY
jgi:hypothetical protein